MSVTLSLFAGVGAQFLDNNGLVLSGGKIYTYSAGTTTPLETYTTNLGTVAQANPIILNASGRVPTGEIWLTTGYGYKFVVEDSNSVLIGTYDNVPSSAQPPITNDASSISYEQGAPTTAGSFVIGNTYLISSIGTTNFQLIGAASNTVGIHFIATGVGSGTGTAQFTRTVQSRLQDSVSVKDFGAVGDGTTDDTLAIQNAINWVAYKYQASGAFAGGSVYMPSGIYKITDALQLGYGEDFHTIYLHGDGPRIDGSTTKSGTAIVPTFNDRPALAINCGIKTTVKNLSIIGKNLTWINDNNLGSYNGTTGINDLVAANWVDPTFPASASSQYAPYCGIAIDAYCGTQPTVHYPNVTFPSWSGITTQYNKNTSTQTVIENVIIQGFVVGIVNQPSDYDANGDYTKILQSFIASNQYAISVGNSQSRVVRVQNCIIDYFYTAFTTGLNGKKAGKPEFLIDSTSFQSGIYILDIPTLSLEGGLKFLNSYAENIYSLGSVGIYSGGTVGSPVSFDTCQFYFTTNSRGSPRYHFLNKSATQVNFLGTSFGSTANTVFVLGGTSSLFRIDNCSSYINLQDYFYQKYPINATGGIIFSGANTQVESFNIRMSYLYNLNTGDGLNTGYINSFVKNTTRETCLPVYANTIACDSYQSADGGFLFYIPQNYIDKGLVTSITTSGRTVIVNLTGAVTNEMRLIQEGGEVGDYYVDGETDTVFFVTARTGLTVTLYAQNNFDASENLLIPITTSGYLYAVNCRLYTFGFVTNGTYTSGNPTITNVARPDGENYYINDAYYGVQENDYLWMGNGFTFSPIAYTDTQIASIGTGTITLSGNMTKSISDARQTLFIRQAPSNNT